ncbi:hypothetical protein SLA2020_071310 [Shorea laevis]
MGLGSSYVAERPKLLSYSLARRIIPRCSVLEVLVTRGLIKDRLGGHTMIAINEDKFLRPYVTCYKDEAPVLIFDEVISGKVKSFKIIPCQALLVSYINAFLCFLN